MLKESCLNCKYSSHKCKDIAAESGWFFYCDYYEELFEFIGKCEHYKKDSRYNE